MTANIQFLTTEVSHCSMWLPGWGALPGLTVAPADIQNGNCSLLDRAPASRDMSWVVKGAVHTSGEKSGFFEVSNPLSVPIFL